MLSVPLLTRNTGNSVLGQLILFAFQWQIILEFIFLNEGFGESASGFACIMLRIDAVNWFIL